MDVEVALASEVFTQMRTLLTVQRMQAVNAVYGTDDPPPRTATHDVLDLASRVAAPGDRWSCWTGTEPANQEDRR